MLTGERTRMSQKKPLIINLHQHNSGISDSFLLTMDTSPDLEPWRRLQR